MGYCICSRMVRILGFQQIDLGQVLANAKRSLLWIYFHAVYMLEEENVYCAFTFEYSKAPNHSRNRVQPKVMHSYFNI